MSRGLRWCVALISAGLCVAGVPLKAATPSESFADAAGASAATAGDFFAGTWELVVKRLDNEQDMRLTLEPDAGGYWGTAGPFQVRGHLEGDVLEVRCLAGGPCARMHLRRKGSSIEGTGEIRSIPVTLRGQRPAERPYSEPRTFDFIPQRFSGQFTNTLPPVLSVYPGDRVHTKTIDAEGFDDHGQKISAYINPQTGPFYINNALPGDTLVVHFERIRTNRSTADMYGNRVVPNALQPMDDPARWQPSAGATASAESAASASSSANANGTWQIENGVARLAQPTERLADFTVATKPMLGCVGVAPPSGQSLRSVNLGSYGGNLDYNGIHEGATVYLPVFQKGAMLFVGDGHALQGDGELTGTGLETSMDVTFSVDLIRGRTLGQPRIEDEEYEMFSGVGGSLDEALQVATSAATHWLAETFALSPSETAMVLGTSLHYDIAEIVDPQIHVVARLRRDTLARIRH
ncbi:MAG TPA: acetamidase/formamidase family protein [Steroidobacteraceae bacterium]|nr:acetamidase/formamidase family protein [Steroidobacteraceae bacterium]